MKTEFLSGVKKIEVTFEDGSTRVVYGSEGWFRSSQPLMPQQGILPSKWPAIPSVSVHLKITDPPDHAVNPSDIPQSLPETPQEA